MQAQISSTDSVSHQDTTDAALRRKNQSKRAGLRHNQAPRHVAGPAQSAQAAQEGRLLVLNML